MNGMLLQIGAAFAAIPAAFLLHVLQTATNKRLKTRIVTTNHHNGERFLESDCCAQPA